MITNTLYKIFWFVGLILLQILILNHIHILGIATPFLYIYFILKMPSGTSRNVLMLWAFFLGLIIDIFSNTPGMNAAASVALAFVRPTYLRLFTPRDLFDNITPSLKTMSLASFLKYSVACVFTQLFVLLTIEFFSFNSIGMMLIRIVSCTILTVACIMAVEGIRR